MEKVNLGTLKGKPILSIGVRGEEQGYIQDCRTWKDAYDLIKDLKAADRQEGFEDKYTIDVEIEDGCYGGYTISKYKGKLKIK